MINLLFRSIWKDSWSNRPKQSLKEFTGNKEINLWGWYWTSFSPYLNLIWHSWILAIAQNYLWSFWKETLSRRILERNTIVFPVHSLLSIIVKKLILHDWEKDYTCPERCLLTWQNEKKSRQKKSIQHARFCFISVGVRAVLRFLVSLKKLGQYKKFPWDKKNISQNISWYVKFFRITMFSWWIKWLSMLIYLKACVHYFLSNFYFSPNDSPFKLWKVFYFI